MSEQKGEENIEQSAIQPLNLPPIKPRLRIYRGKEQIWDSQRRQFVALTPEEWVRQHFVSFLVSCRAYSPTLMANEVCIKLNGMSRRCDSVLYSPDLTPRMIIEYKRPNVKISKNVFAQICRYNLVMHVDYLIVSNGLEHYCCKMDYESNSYHFLADIPEYGDL